MTAYPDVPLRSAPRSAALGGSDYDSPFAAMLTSETVS